MPTHNVAAQALCRRAIHYTTKWLRECSVSITLENAGRKHAEEAAVGKIDIGADTYFIISFHLSIGHDWIGARSQFHLWNGSFHHRCHAARRIKALRELLCFHLEALGHTADTVVIGITLVESLFVINLGNDDCTDTQSECQTENLGHIVLPAAKEITPSHAARLLNKMQHSIDD